MPDDPTTQPVDLNGWIIWRQQQRRSLPTLRAVLDELPRLGEAEIVAIVATWAVPGLLGEPGPQVLSPDDVVRGRLDLVNTRWTFGGIEPGAPIFTVPDGAYINLKFRLIDAARFRQYLDGELASFGLPPPPPIPDEPSPLPEFGLPLPPMPDDPPRERISVKKLISFLFEEYQERPPLGEFWRAAQAHFTGHHVPRARADDALKAPQVLKVFGPIPDPKTGRWRGRSPRKNS